MNSLLLIIKNARKKWRTTESRSRLKLNISRIENLQILIGAGGTSFPGWVTTDLQQFNISRETDWKYYFKKNKPLKLLAEHVLEHLTLEQVELALTFSFKYLRKGGVFRIAVPDAYHNNETYLNAVKPGGWDKGADDHLTFWDIDSLKHIGEKTGFIVKPLEYFDKNRVFHITNYCDDNGHIKRSIKNNYSDVNVPEYSSLILDLIKP